MNISESKNWITTDKMSESADRSKTAEYSESTVINKPIVSNESSMSIITANVSEPKT